MTPNLFYSDVSLLALLFEPGFFYASLQFGIALTFSITAIRRWRESPSRLRELLSAALFGLLLEQGDILIFQTYRYDRHWFTLGDVPIGIALTWAMIILSAMNISDALGIPSIVESGPERGIVGTARRLVRGAVAPIADAVWAIMLDLAFDAIAIRLGLWTWTIRLDQGWFGVPWGNFFGWLFVAAFFSFFTRLVRANGWGNGQWLVPIAAFGGLVVVLVPFVAVERMIGSSYNDQAWIIFAVTLGLFFAVTTYGLRGPKASREPPDHWLLLVRGAMHLLFLLTIVATGVFLQLPLLLLVSLSLFAIEIVLTSRWSREWAARFIQTLRPSQEVPAK